MPVVGRLAVLATAGAAAFDDSVAFFVVSKHASRRASTMPLQMAGVVDVEVSVRRERRWREVFWETRLSESAWCEKKDSKAAGGVEGREGRDIDIGWL